MSLKVSRKEFPSSCKMLSTTYVIYIKLFTSLKNSLWINKRTNTLPMKWAKTVNLVVISLDSQNVMIKSIIKSDVLYI